MKPLQQLSAVFLTLLVAIPDCSFGSDVEQSVSAESVEELSMTSALLLGDFPEEPVFQEPYHSSEEYGRNLRSRPLCHPCKELFKLVRERVKDVAHLEKPQLQGMIDDACKQLHQPLLERVCRKIGAKELDRLFDLIVNKDKLIDPDHACKALHACK
ncbi:hypothetical protein M3Y99_01232500 [Aphelenchoides fujianensis]|nr:hypothetical protein M3Y99_01232500 [Aphelenchoides fujianensis]